MPTELKIMLGKENEINTNINVIDYAIRWWNFEHPLFNFDIEKDGEIIYLVISCKNLVIKK